MAERTCSVSGCTVTDRLKRGMCGKHYKRWYRYGDPTKAAPANGELLRWLRAFVASAQDVDGDGCMVGWPYHRNADGYPKLMVNGQHRLAHQVVLELTGRPRPPGQEARHLCGNGHLGCLRPDHLAWGTHAENGADMASHTRIRRGAAHHKARLTEADVVAIRASSLTQRELAVLYGVGQPAIQKVRSRQRWAWVQ